MSTPQIVAVSDVHLDHNRFGRMNPATGRSTALESTLACLNAAADHAIAIGASAFVTTGDETMTGRPRPETVEQWADILRRLTGAGIPAVCLIGNHSLYGGIPAGERTYNHRFADIAGVHLIENSGIITLPDGLQICGLSWPRRAEVAAASEHDGTADHIIGREMVDTVRRLADQTVTSRPSLFIGHLTVAEAKLGTDRRGSEVLIHSVFEEPTINVDVLEEGPWATITLGHIHKRQQIGTRTHYVGSLDRIDFGEARDPKGWSTVTADGAVTFHPSPARNLVVIDAARELPDELPDGAVIKVICAQGERTPPAELRALATEHGAVIAKVDPAPKIAVTATATGPALEQGISPLEGFKIWADTQPFTETEADRYTAAAIQLAAHVEATR